MALQPSASCNLFILRSPFPERLKSFYESLLKTTFEHHTDHCSSHYAASLGDVVIEIYLTKSALPAHDGIGFRVESIKAAIERVGEQYVRRPTAQSPYGLATLLRDPDNRIVHLTEIESD